jgi:hypothetical protein
MESEEADVVEVQDDEVRRPGQTMQIARRLAEDGDDDSIIKPRELIEITYPKGQSPSLTARRTLALLLAAAAGNAWRAGTHRIRKSDLRRAHKGNERIRDLLDEVDGIRMRCPTVSSRGRPAIERKGLFEKLVEETEDSGSAHIEFAFNKEARELFGASNVWGQLNRAAILSFQSKYTVSLYEIGCLYSGRAEPTLHVAVRELRERLGVATGQYPDWAQFERRVLKPAKSEIDQLAHFTMHYQPIRKGRRTVEVRINFWRKDPADAAAAQREVDRPRVGRRARREDQVDHVVEQRPLNFGTNDEMPSWS